MEKDIRRPENISKTQYVEEMFRNIKDAPENKKKEAMLDQVRHLNDEAEDVGILEKGAAAHEQGEDEDSMYRDDVVEISSAKHDEEEEEDSLSEVESELNAESGVEYLEDNEDEDEDPKGRFLDIEG